MKAKPRLTIGLAQPLAAFAVLPLVFYVFTHNQLYTLILKALDSVFPTFHSYQTLILPVLFVGLSILAMFGNEKVSSRTYLFLWILLAPSILWFSNLDWFKILGLPFDLGMVAANLPFVEILIIGLVLVTTNICLSFISQIKNTRQELLSRGALEPDIQRAINEQSIFFSKLIFGCFGVALLIVTATLTAKTALQALLPPLQYFYIVLGLSSATTLIICMALYLKSHAETSKKAEQKQPVPD